MKEPTYADTVEFIQEAHRGQTDAAGKPYWTHPKRVAGIVAKMDGSGDQEELIALLHDVIEDTKHTAGSLLARGYSMETVMGVVLVSRDKDKGTYAEFIQSIADSGFRPAMRVKLADLEDNTDPERVAQLPAEKQGIVKRYEKAKAVLRAALEPDHSPMIKLEWGQEAPSCKCGQQFVIFDQKWAQCPSTLV